LIGIVNFAANKTNSKPKLKKMKKNVMLLSALLTLTVATFAQRGKGSDQSGLYIEVLAQPGMTMGGNYQVQEDAVTATPTYVDMNKTFTFGINAGAQAGYNFTDNIGVSAGLIFSHQGQDYKYTYSVIDTATLKRTVSLNYFKIPILFNYTAPINSQVSFICSAGIYFGILTGYKDETTVTMPGETDVMTASGSTLTETGTVRGISYTNNAVFTTKPYTSGDFGGILAAGFQFQLSSNIYLPITLNYQIGFNNVKNVASTYTETGNPTGQLFWQQNGSGDPNLTLAYHNSSLELKIGVKIFLK